MQAMQAKQKEKEAQDLESDPLVPQSPNKQSS